VTAAMSLPDGIGARFELRGALGAGSMGVVLRAFDRELAREVALKTLPDRGLEETLHLKAEFRLLANVLHPNLVELFELFSGDEHCFFTMELLAGVTFDQHLAAAVDIEARVARVVAALPQLVSGIATLHAADTLHRDIKPSNIMVDGARVVLLDFGLAQRLWGADQAAESGGTWDYMAPEAVWGRAGPAADWYSLGVALHEALAGALPFAGAPAVSLARKQRGQRSPLPAEVPAWLSDLIDALLLVAPEARPDALTIVRSLAAAGLTGATVAAPPGAQPRPFVGRVDAWRALEDGRVRAERGVAVVQVHGPSGIGKSELLARFARDLERAHGALVLHGLCHPQEQVPYNALDSAIDELTRWLEHPLVDAAALHPAEPAAAARLFPVMRRLPGFADAGEADALPPNIQRRRGAEALAELLARIGATRPLALVLDDVHWGDQDSAELLRLIVRSTADLRLLIVLGHRDDDDPGALLRDLREQPLTDEAARDVPLVALSAGEADALLAALLAARGLPPGPDDRALIEASAGSPFLLDALARDRLDGAARPGDAADRVIDLVARRLAAVDPDARRLVEFTALAAAPLAAHVVFAAAALDPRRRTLVRHLEHHGLVRSGAFGGRARLDIHHDRIRQAVLARLDPTTRRHHHLALAGALAEYPDTDPELLVTHYLGGERRDLAAGHATRAAERAAAALAFDRAVALYRRALELDADGAAARPLRVALAESLVNAGRGGEAAEQFLHASRDLQAGAPADPEVVQLRCRAAEHFVRIGRMDEGIDLFRDVLASVGVALPRDARAATARSALGRVRLLLPGSRLTLARNDGLAPNLSFRPDHDVSPAARQRLDLMWRASSCFGLSQHALADYLGVTSLQGALEAGDRWSVARALGYEATFQAALGGRLFAARSLRTLRTVEALLAGSDDPYQRAFVDVIRGTWAWNRGRWHDCVTHCDAAIALLERRCPGSDWEAAVARLYALSARAMSGAWAELAPRADEALAHALERGDLFSANNYRLGELGLYRLAADEAARARQIAGEAEATWPRDPHHTQRYYHVVLLTQVDLYEADADAAWARIAGAWPMLTAGQYLLIECLQAGLWFLRGRAALALACRPRALPRRRSLWPWATPSPVREVERAVAVLTRSVMPAAAPFAATLRAGLLALHGDRPRAAQAASEAAAGYGRAGMALHREVLGLRAAGYAHDTRAADAHLTWLNGQGVRQPERLAQTLAPTP
jgi:hypothetical protein